MCLPASMQPVAAPPCCLPLWPPAKPVWPLFSCSLHTVNCVDWGQWHAEAAAPVGARPTPLALVCCTAGTAFSLHQNLAVRHMFSHMLWMGVACTVLQLSTACAVAQASLPHLTGCMCGHNLQLA